MMHKTFGNNNGDVYSILETTHTLKLQQWWPVERQVEVRSNSNILHHQQHLYELYLYTSSNERRELELALQYGSRPTIYNLADMLVGSSRMIP
jgi:hypothetical protein